MLYNNTDRKYVYCMPADMVLVISYNRICQPEHMRGCERIVKTMSNYNDVTTIIKNHKQKQKNNSCLEMFRIW